MRFSINGLRVSTIAACGLIWSLSVLRTEETDLIQYVEPQAETGSSLAVVVGKTPLAHTTQFFALDPAGKILGPKRPAVQTERVLNHVREALIAAGSTLEQVVRLNVYVANSEVVTVVQNRLKTEFPGKEKPAVTYVVGTLAHPEALVGMDAVAAAPEAKIQEVTLVRAPAVSLPQCPAGSAAATVLPAGTTVYISGQAEPGQDLAEATRKTLHGLEATLKHLGLNLAHVVQVKSFVQPMSKIARVEKEIHTLFGEHKIPAVTFVEWISKTPSIEIELIAYAPEGTLAAQLTGDTSAYITPPGMTASPVFSRVAVVRGARTIYTSSLIATAGETAEAEVREIYGTLGRLLQKAGSDLKHLAKATYYVTNDEASTKLNVIRPEFYDPQRPPAASKAPVRAVGNPGKGIVIDMIAVQPPAP